MDVNTQGTSPTTHRISTMSDEERIAILADIILDTISLEDEQA